MSPTGEILDVKEIKPCRFCEGNGHTTLEQRDALHKKLLCFDCKQLHADYIVDDWIWVRSGLPKNRGRLCIPCLERRARHKLEIEDFKEVPTNQAILWAYELGRRDAEKAR